MCNFYVQFYKYPLSRSLIAATVAMVFSTAAHAADINSTTTPINRTLAASSAQSLSSAASSPLIPFYDKPVDTDGDTDTTPRSPKRPLVRYTTDPFAKMDNVFSKAASNPIAVPELARALKQLELLRRSDTTLDQETSLIVRNAAVDEMGTLNVRFQQTYNGIFVKNGGFISHLQEKKNYEEDSDFLKRGIRLDVRPRLSRESAIQLVSEQRSHVLPYSWEPRAELQIHPQYQNLLDETGKAALKSDFDLTADDAAPGINAERVPRTILGYKLVWSIKTLEGVENGFGPHSELESVVDANTGELISQRPLASEIVGTGTGPHVGTVSINTKQESKIGFRMTDTIRNYSTMDDDFDSNESPNQDFDNVWGSLTQFPFAGGDGGLQSVRQGAMVDVHHFSRVFWDLQKNVFKRNGVDNDFAETNNFVHNDFKLANAAYHWWTGNIVYGDDPNMQAADVVAHEHGHAFQHETNGLGGDVDESIADIWGVLGELYFTSGNFSAQSTKLPASVARDVTSSRSNLFVNSVGRDMVKPSRQAGTPNFFFPGIDQLEIHTRGGPNNRAFYFMSQGASCQMTDADYSDLLPWGMTGIGPAAAGGVLAHAMINDMPDGPDYLETRNAMVTGAQHMFGANAAQTNATRNAYAGINVGAKAANYPAMPLTIVGQGIRSLVVPQFLGRPLQPTKPAECPNKLTVLSTSGNDHFYTVSIPAGKKLTVALQPSFSKMQVTAQDKVLGTSVLNVTSEANTFIAKAGTAPGPVSSNRIILLHVTQLTPTPANLPSTYFLSVNWE
ncbi:MAG: hypothetical protein EOO53_07475 [Gammaproteobacteria bacterium]|nr:MAG: hypothetical protein EOO53_07475 [Gammaproteobacteria bacterium]